MMMMYAVIGLHFSDIVVLA